MLKNIFLCLLISIMSLHCTKKENSNQSSKVISVLDANISSLDPIHSTNRYASIVTASIFEGLYHYHFLKRPIELEPMLAESMPIISKDRLTYTIKLKKGVFFQDDPSFDKSKGKEFTAEDVIYSWKRLADPKNKALGWWMLDGKIKGLNEWRDAFRKGKVNYDSPVEGLKAIDPFTLQITLTKPSFQFTHILATTPTLITAREVVETYGKEIVNHPVGTGPFQLKKWTRNSEVHLVKNPNYHKVFYPKEGDDDSMSRGLMEDAGKLLPLADEVIIKVFPERQPMWLSFLKGKLDHGIIPKDNYDQVFENNQLKPEILDKGINILYQYRPDVVFIAINMEHPLLGKNKMLRKALGAALDKNLILEKFYNKRGLVAEGPIPPGIDGYDDKYTHPLKFDPTLAKKYLAQAGFPEGKGLPVFDYDLPNVSTTARQFGEFLKDRWALLGIKVKLQSNTWPQFDKKIKTKKATLFDMAWMADYPDSENFLQLFYSKNVSPGSNNFNFINRSYDELFEQFLKLPVGEERNQLIRKMVDLINEEVPAIFTVHRIFRLPYHGWLKNYNEFPIIYDHLKYLRVDEAKKQELLKNL